MHVSRIYRIRDPNMLYRPDGAQGEGLRPTRQQRGRVKREEIRSGIKQLSRVTVSTPRFFSYKVGQRLPAFDFCPSTLSLLKLEGGSLISDHVMNRPILRLRGQVPDGLLPK